MRTEAAAFSRELYSQLAIFADNKYPKSEKLDHDRASVRSLPIQPFKLSAKTVAIRSYLTTQDTNYERIEVIQIGLRITTLALPRLALQTPSQSHQNEPPR